MICIMFQSVIWTPTRCCILNIAWAGPPSIIFQNVIWTPAHCCIKYWHIRYLHNQILLTNQLMWLDDLLKISSSLTFSLPLTLRLDKGARCSVLVKNLRPTREVTQLILNPAPRQGVTDLVAVRHRNITHSGLTYKAIYFTSPLFPDLELHAAKRFTVVTHKGHGDGI